MTELTRDALEQRVLILAPIGRDAEMTRSVLERAGATCHCARNLADVCRELDVGAGLVVVVEEAVATEGREAFVRWLHDQPPWSDLPVLVVARQGADSAAVAQSMDLLGNVTVLERPIRVAALVSAVRTSLRTRQRQYESRAHLARIELSERDLRDSDRRKDEFLAVLAHELRNPLAPIRNALHILQLTRHEDVAARVGAMMERQVNHMVRLVDDLMEVSRITRGKIELRREPVELAVVVRSAVEIGRPLIESAGHQLTLTIPQQPVIVQGDAVRLTQVVANLLNNAAKYTDPGGGIGLTVRQDGDSATISVRDTGTGIPPDMLPRVFDLFTQVDHHAGRSQGGLGIGLTLVKSLVEMHGGSVMAYSEGPGRGSEFVVRLPLAADARCGTDEPRRDAGSAPLMARRRVLIVDDNHDAADSLGTLLELRGAEVRVAYNGHDCLRAVATHRPAVVLLDIGMPGKDGYEVAHEIRRLPEANGVTLIALSGWGQKADRDLSRAAGFDYHLIKPVDIQALEALLITVDGEAVGRRTGAEHGPRSA
ncbi:MAG TPA: ATP-binding protein [Methylomirabilota bacterium]|nr:ATP-binding protein [Methylomirabilota bacterium]